MPNQYQSEISRSYNSISGADIKALIGPFTFAELQGVSYSISREKAPIYVMGSADPMSFSRNKRGIAGSLVWINFDRHALLALVSKMNGRFVANKDDIRPDYYGNNDLLQDQSQIFNSKVVRSSGIPLSATVDQQAEQSRLTNVSGFKEEAKPWYSDQVLPFDITMAGTNELGAACSMKIFGVEILNEGFGISVDDSVSESQATFVARAVEPWQAVKTNFPSISGVR